MARIFALLATIGTVVSALRSKSLGPGCSFSIQELGQPQPLYLYSDNYLEPNGSTGVINLNAGEKVTIACPGLKILHPLIMKSVDVATATCENNDLISGDGWLEGNGTFSELTCSAIPKSEAVLTADRCYNDNAVISVGFTVKDVFYPLYWSCFDQRRLEVLYVWYKQNPTNAVPQTGVKKPVTFSASTFFPGVAVHKMYYHAQQEATIANIVGSDMASKYVTYTQYLARGRLAAETDFVFAEGQRATFYFINVAPQWQQFNDGNWKRLEQNLRSRISEAGYNTTIYTGTFGISQLRDKDDRLVNVYLYTDENNNGQIPVPLYYYKVVHDESRCSGTAFVGINNPYYSETEVKDRVFCEDQCRGNSEFNWLKWEPDRIDLGYSFCCTIDDFRKTVPHLPNLLVDDLLV